MEQARADGWDLPPGLSVRDGVGFVIHAASLRPNGPLQAVIDARGGSRIPTSEDFARAAAITLCEVIEEWPDALAEAGFLDRPWPVDLFARMDVAWPKYLEWGHGVLDSSFRERRDPLYSLQRGLLDRLGLGPDGPVSSHFKSAVKGDHDRRMDVLGDFVASGKSLVFMGDDGNLRLDSWRVAKLIKKGRRASEAGRWGASGPLALVAPLLDEDPAAPDDFNPTTAAARLERVRRVRAAQEQYAQRAGPVGEAAMACLRGDETQQAAAKRLSVSRDRIAREVKKARALLTRALVHLEPNART